MATGIRTNADFYEQISHIASVRQEKSRPLEDYLCAIGRLLLPRADREGISGPALAALLEAAFDAEPAVFPAEAFAREEGATEEDTEDAPRTEERTGWDAAWLAEAIREQNRREAATGFRDVAAILATQARDLAIMRARGELDGRWIYFGIDGPDGQRWYNFNPSLYIRCATAGTFGGWETEETPQELRSSGKPQIDWIPWGVLHRFFSCGRSYE